jgi:hypothetical protein
MTIYYTEYIAYQIYSNKKKQMVVIFLAGQTIKHIFYWKVFKCESDFKSLKHLYPLKCSRIILVSSYLDYGSSTKYPWMITYATWDIILKNIVWWKNEQMIAGFENPDENRFSKNEKTGPKDRFTENRLHKFKFSKIWNNL